MTTRGVFLDIGLALTALVLGSFARIIIAHRADREQPAQGGGAFQAGWSVWTRIRKRMAALRSAPRRLWAKQIPTREYSPRSDIDAFLEAAARLPALSGFRRGRLIFALDATMSPEAKRIIAQSVQGPIFFGATAYGGVDVQIVFFRGFSECRASHFIAGGQNLDSLVRKIEVSAGRTQIEKVFRHTLEETGKTPVQALVFMGDAVEEPLDVLARLAADLGRHGTKTFLFQRGRNGAAERAFQRLSQVNGGAYASFDLSAPERLSGLLSACAAYAAGGRQALEYEARVRCAPAALHLLSQMRSRDDKE